MRRNRGLGRAALIFFSFPTLVAIALGIAVATALTLRFAKDFWVITLAAAGAPDVAVAEAVQQLHKGVDVTGVRVLRSDSPGAASAAVDAGQAELAIVRSDVAVPQRAGTMLVVHRDAALLFASPHSKITKVADLAKKRVGIVPGDPANIQLFDELLTYHAIPVSSVSHIPVQTDQLASLSTNKLVDALFLVAPLRSPLVERVFTLLSAGEKSRPALIEIKNAEGIAARRVGISKIEVPAGFFRGSVAATQRRHVDHCGRSPACRFAPVVRVNGRSCNEMAFLDAPCHRRPRAVCRLYGSAGDREGLFLRAASRRDGILSGHRKELHGSVWRLLLHSSHGVGRPGFRRRDAGELISIAWPTGGDGCH